jgi:hypothetical protein
MSGDSLMTYLILMIMLRVPSMSNNRVEQLIELFQEEACLWDVNDMNCMNADSRQPTAGCIKSGLQSRTRL